MPAALSPRVDYELAQLGSRAEAQPSTVSVLRSPAEIDAIADAWRDLERRSSQPAFFQSAAWSLLACRTFHELHGRTFQPVVVTVRRGRELVAIAPFRISRSGPIRIANDLTDPFGQYGGMLIADDANAETVVAEIVIALKSAMDIDGLRVRRLRADSPVRPALLRRGFAASATDAAPFVDLQPFARFEDYLRTVNAKSRKNLRNLRNRLARVGPVSHRVMTGDDVRSVIDESFEGRLRWLDEQGIPSMAFGHPAFGAMLGGVRELAQRGDVSVLAMGLYCGDVPVSLQWGFVRRGRYYAYIAARNPDFDAYSPGRLHLEDVIRTCFEQGVKVCDFLAPAVPYKLTWTEQATDLVDVAVPFTLAGRLWLDGWDRRLRPAIKRHYLRLPPWLRRGIRRMTSESPPAAA